MGFGSGLAHALTQGLSGYQEGSDERMKQLIALAARQQAEARAKQQDEIARLGAITGAVNAGLDVSSRRTRDGVRPTTPEAGQPAPPSGPVPDPSTIGSLGDVDVRIPAGGVVDRATRADDARRTQQQADRKAHLVAYNDSLPAGHPYKLSPEQVEMVSHDDALYNEYAKRTTGLYDDPRSIHQANRQFDVDHPTRDASATEPSWQVVTTADGSMVQVNPKTGETRPLGLQGKAATSAASGLGAAALRKAVAENKTQLATIDAAIRELEAYPNAVGLSRGTGLVPGLGELAGQVNQRRDPKGERARNALQNATSISIVNRSGKAVTKTEMASLGFLPNVASTAQANLEKLRGLRDYVVSETANLEEQTGRSPTTPHATNDRGGNVDLAAPPGKPDLSTRIQQLKAQKLSKDAARAQLRKEGYDLGVP